MHQLGRPVDLPGFDGERELRQGAFEALPEILVERRVVDRSAGTARSTLAASDSPRHGRSADWLADHDLADPAVEVAQADLAAAIALRTAVRQSLSGDGNDGAAATAFADHPLVLAPDESGGLRLAARSGRPWLDAIVETVAVAACRGDWGRIKLCAAPDCRWAFHDTSRSGRGRWCDMNVCGNRHKTRTYRERHQQAT